MRRKATRKKPSLSADWDRSNSAARAAPRVVERFSACAEENEMLKYSVFAFLIVMAGCEGSMTRAERRALEKEFPELAKVDPIGTLGIYENAQLRRVRWEYLSAISAEERQDILGKKIRIGMPANVVVITLGFPTRKYDSEHVSGRSSHWVYRRSGNRTLHVFFDQQVVTSWSDG